MTYNNPSELSNEELLKTKKKLELILFAITAIFFLSFAGILLIDKSYRNYVTFFIPFILTPPIYFNFKGLNEIKRELKLRNMNP